MMTFHPKIYALL